MEDGPLTNDAKQDYPGIFERVKAALTDSAVVIIMMILSTSLFSVMDDVPDVARMLAFIFIIGLYDPIFTSMLGGTIGHMVVGIRVKRFNNPEKNLLFPLALIRFLVKLLLGWLSLITVGSQQQRKAIHDLVVNSIVVYHNRKA